MQVVNCTTPANYFHVLRRQVRRNFRKPLVVMTPKSLLRHKAAVSDLAEMGPGTSFHRLLDEKGTKVNHGKARRIVMCSGKVYYGTRFEVANYESGFLALMPLKRNSNAPMPMVRNGIVAWQRKRRLLHWWQARLNCNVI